MKKTKAQKNPASAPPTEGGTSNTGGTAVAESAAAGEGGYAPSASGGDGGAPAPAEAPAAPSTDQAPPEEGDGSDGTPQTVSA